nr:uncharacterized protein LOC106687268 [Halyomorpha halys]
MGGQVDRRLLAMSEVEFRDSSCSSRSPSLLTVCVKRRVPSDENLAELVRRPPQEWAPLPRWVPPYHYPLRHVYYHHDPYAWLPDEEEPCRMERGRTLRGGPDYDGYPPRRYMSYSSEYLLGRHEPCPAHPHLPPPPPPPQIPTAPHRPKHVSFARSHTMQSFEDTVSFGSGSCITSCSQERLIDGKKIPDTPKVIVMEKAKRAPMKTQATQTEVCLGRKPLPPNYLSLSPRTVQRVRMVSQGAQTNGDRALNRKLMKSLSEAAKIGQQQQVDVTLHEPLQRTQSEEPRSPYLPTSPKEIFINFEPLEKKGKKKLAKTLSDGEILENKQKDEGEPCTLSDGELQKSGLSEITHDDLDLEITSPQKQKLLISADSQEEEFHENLIYQDMFRKSSLESPGDGKGLLTPASPSPFASCDSLNTKDHSDGMWNESQMTVLHADSDNNGAGTCMSGSDVSSSLTPSAALNSMTPSTRRKHLLMMQHAQRSSMDTDALECEETAYEPDIQIKTKQEKSPSVPTLAVTIPIHDITPEPLSRTSMQKEKEMKMDRPLSPALRGKRRSPGTRTPESDYHHSSSQTLSSNEAFARSDSGRTNTDMSEASTTDDYATATENNSDGSGRPQQQQPGTGSFESGSSLYSLTRTDATEEQQVCNGQVPSSPPLIEEEQEKGSEEKGREGDGDTSSPESSTCGSYSVEGSSEKLGHSDKSGHCSSTGGYDSPFEDRTRKSKWTSDDKTKVKKRFTLELSTSMERPESPIKSARSPWQKKSIITPVEIEKEKTRSRSPVPGKKTPVQISREVTPITARSPAETLRKEDWLSQRMTPDEKKGKLNNGIGIQDTSDESSEECTCGKNKRARENQRRKTPPVKSPTIHTRRKSMPGEDLPKRRCSISAAKSPSPQEDQAVVTGSRLSPYTVHSPGGSPSKHHRAKVATSPDSARLKALSAESLRSVSPGSDSVFYSEPSSNATGETAPSTCSHCGMLYETQAAKPAEKPAETIVQPPAGFEDSPRTPHRTRLYKKAEKRFRSEERRHRMHAEAARAKSEERAREERKDKIRPLARSTDASMEKLHSSSLDDDDEWTGVLSEAYNTGTWVYIGAAEEQQFWQRPESKVAEEEETEEHQRLRKDSSDSTQSENEFKRRYQAIAHRMVHRKSSLEMYKRLASKSFEADKRVLVRRVSGEFGFRIHGSKPVVVSAIESGTPAESSGLEVGDIIISVNNTNVLDATHSEVVKLAHAGSDTLELEVVRTYDKFSTKASVPSPVICGCLYRMSISSSKLKPVWVLRYFILKEDHCLYHYKSDFGGQPLGALRVTDHMVSLTSDPERPHSFKISRKGCSSVHLAASSAAETEQWVAALAEACKPLVYSWMSDKCLKAPPTKIHEPDCVGTLSTLIHHRGKTWRRRFCILKDACLYFYTDINAEKAIGMVCLHGYRVQSLTSASRRFSFELFPPEPSLLHFYFYTDTELDKKRWLAALEYSIDRWIKIG